MAIIKALEEGSSHKSGAHINKGKPLLIPPTGKSLVNNMAMRSTGRLNREFTRHYSPKGDEVD